MTGLGMEYRIDSSELLAAHVGHNALLHFLPDPVGLGQDTPLPDSRRRNLSYTFF